MYEVVRVRIVLVAVECLEYDFLKECNTPNIDRLGPHPAITMGGCTRASVPALLGGILPRCVAYEVEIDRSYIARGRGLTDERRKTSCKEHTSVSYTLSEQLKLLATKMGYLWR